MARQIDERQLLHALSLSVLATDETGIVAFANDAATELFRTSTDRAGGPPGAASWSSLTSRRPSGPCLEVLGGTRWQGDLTIRRSVDDTLVAAVDGHADPRRRPAASSDRSSHSRT